GMRASRPHKTYASEILLSKKRQLFRPSFIMLTIACCLLPVACCLHAKSLNTPDPPMGLNSNNLKV
ncbi:MAG: hypothetical protein IJ268_12740, partial [Proteobacteria bacterium]|nr:hypothetical protein [Pseudomonadota bacterium]